jgi:putative transposase
VVIGVLEYGTKELVGIYDGHRESKESWREALLDLKRRGVAVAPHLGIGDGALGFRPALEEVFPKTRHRRCRVHKTMNVLDKMPKSVHGYAKTLLHEMYMAPAKEKGLKAFDAFMRLYEAKYPKACECLRKDKDQLFTFYDYPAEHWQHIRTTNPIESTFATVRHRTRQTKGCGSRIATLTMVFKPALSAQKHWRKLRGYQLIERVVKGVRFKDGIEVKSAEKVA